MSLTPYLYVPFIAWIIAQLIKFVIEILKGDADVRYLYASGGMPSAHSAVVCCLAMYALINAGPSSPIFGITAIIAAIVMYDSFGVRRSSGEQAKTLNKLVSELARSGNLRKPSEFNQLREILGHQPLEVLAGALLGAFVAVLFSWKQLEGFYSSLQQPVVGWQITILFVVGAVLIIAPVVKYFLLRKSLKKNKATRTLFLTYALGTIVAGLAALFCGFVAQQQIGPYNQLWVSLTLGTAWVIFIVIIAGVYLSNRNAYSLKTSEQNRRKEDWLKKAGKKK